jgi:hypothetical protein
MASTLEEQVVAYVEVTGATITKQAAQLDHYARREAASQAMIPLVIDAVIAAGIATPRDKQAMATALADPALALTYFKNIIEHSTSASANQLGRPASGKQASVTTPTTGGTKLLSVNAPCPAADTAFLRALGL